MALSMQDHILYPSLAAAGLVFFTGLLTQLFIVVVNIMDWMNGRPKTPVDQIITSLGITRIVLLSSTFLDAMCMIFLQRYMESHWHTFLFLTANSSNFFDIWLGAFFSVVFCLKICNFHNAFSLYLKTLISRRVVHLIVGLVLCSICFVLLIFITNHVTTSRSLLQNLTSKKMNTPEERHHHIILTIEISIPLLIYCLSSLLLIVSLCLHMNRMKSNSNVSTNLDTYYKAIQFMTLSLIGFMLRIGSDVVILFLYHALDDVWLFVIWNSVVILNSIYLIYRTNKLSNRFSKILLHGLNCILPGKCSVSNSRDQEESITTTL